MTPRGHVLVAVCLGLLVLSGVSAAVVAPASSGDRSTAVYADPDVYTVAPGGTVAIQVMVNSDGGYNNVGLETMTVNATYDTSYLTAESVESGTYMERGNQTSVASETAIETDDGLVSVEQWRDPPRGGATGTARFATITFRVAEDAPETNTTVRFGESRGALVGDYAVFVFAQNATVSIDEDAPVWDDQSAGPAGGGGDSLVTDSEALLTGGLIAVVGAALAGVAVGLKRRRAMKQ